MRSAEGTVHARVFGLQRSGNHAVIGWLMAQFPRRRICFLENVGHDDGDFFETADSIETEAGRVPADEVAAIRSSAPQVVIASFEDDLRKLRPHMPFLESVFSIDRAAQLTHQFGPPARSLEIIILRDPFNFFASRLAKLEKLTGVKDLARVKAEWKRMAGLFLEDIERPMPDRVCVRFNSWFADQSYRRTLSDKIGGTFSDASLQTVHPAGGGSSFDGRDYGNRLEWRHIARNWRKLLDPRRYLRTTEYLRRLFTPGARSMKVLERWQRMLAVDEYRALFDDPELVELSEAVFGTVPDTSVLTSHGRRRPARRLNG